VTRDFHPPNAPPHFSGTMWLNKDGSVGAEISDVFNTPIHLIAKKNGSEYHVQGWRGEPPEFLRMTYEARPDGLPDDAPRDGCGKCEGRLFWRTSIVSNPAGGGVWRCATCEPYDPNLWIDAVALPAKKVTPAKTETLAKTGTLL
jgi:hypothetical protein